MISVNIFTCQAELLGAVGEFICSRVRACLPYLLYLLYNKI
ncbi:hypothetical protein VRK_34370 [Vibrio sp. MEBiC08052]|nr:hypothetical protein VRK_34370 [Vibrio sp. MEBiC08052]